VSKKRIITIIVIIILIAIGSVSVYFIMTGGKDEQSGEDTQTTMSETTTENIYYVLSNTDSLSSFKTLINTAGLAKTLENTEKKFIVMAPTNEAFGKLPEGYYDSLLTEAKLENAKSITKYHVAEVTSTELTDGQKLKTLEGQEVIVGVSEDQFNFTDAKGDKAIARTTQNTANGTLYIINAVLLPQ
jgi:uncharacterized surface protein with fasciclin (FAS1) repeats